MTRAAAVDERPAEAAGAMIQGWIPRCELSNHRRVRLSNLCGAKRRGQQGAGHSVEPEIPMGKWMGVVLTLAIAVAPVFAAAPATAPVAGRDVSSDLKTIVDENKLPGMAAIAIEGDHVTM